MRTTLTLDDDVAARLRAEASRTGKPFRTVVNEYLRLGLARRREFGEAPVFEIETFDLGGLQPGLDYDDVAGLIEAVEGPLQR